MSFRFDVKELFLLLQFLHQQEKAQQQLAIKVWNETIFTAVKNNELVFKNLSSHKLRGR